MQAAALPVEAHARFAERRAGKQFLRRQRPAGRVARAHQALVADGLPVREAEDRLEMARQDMAAGPPIVIDCQVHCRSPFPRGEGRKERAIGMRTQKREFVNKLAPGAHQLALRRAQMVHL